MIARSSLRVVSIACALVVVAVVGACQSAADDANAGASGLPCAVDALVERRCRTCHSNPPRHGAPMPLTKHEHFTAPSRQHASSRVLEQVQTRIHDDARPMPPPPNAMLDAAEAKVLSDWIAGGARPSTATCAGNAHPDAAKGAVTRLSCAPDVHVRPAAPYALSADTDDILVCYGFETDRTTKRHIVGFAPSIGSDRVLHHVTLLQSDVPVSPVPAPCAPEAMTTWRPLYGWAPGASGMEMPSEAGFPDQPGSHYVVQLHYVNPDHQPILETSGFDLCTTDRLRPNDADVYAFGTVEITIPARASLTRDCSITVPPDGATTHLFAAFPHMHKLGRSIRTVAHPGGIGSEIDLGSVSAWSFGNQSWLPIDTTLRPGDVVRTPCTWPNSTDNAVGYGPTSDDEMCFSYVMYYPKIETGNWNWSLPALYSTCK